VLESENKSSLSLPLEKLMSSKLNLEAQIGEALKAEDFEICAVIQQELDSILSIIASKAQRKMKFSFAKKI
jgi:hypothetical protein